MNHIIVLILFTVGNSILLTKAKALLTEKIVGGYEATTTIFKYLVIIEENGKYECNGGIIDDMLIMSVAHCVVNKDAAQFYHNSFKVVVTSNYLLPNETIASALVEKVYLPKKFNVDTYSQKKLYEIEEDFIILKLKTGLGIGSNPLLQKLLLPKRSFLDPKKSYLVAGHGTHMISANGVRLPKDGKLRYANVEIISNKECSSINNFHIRSFFVCARVTQVPGMVRGVCKGDSGTPLVLNGEIVVGVLVLNSKNCNEKILTGIYLRISHYSKFINNAMKGDTSNMRVFSLIGDSSTGYSFIEDLVAVA